MKKLLVFILGSLLAFTPLLSPLVSAQGSDNEFFGGGGGSAGSDYETTEEDAQNAGESFIKKVDFLGTTLLRNTFLYLFAYPQCFSVKDQGGKKVIYYKPSICAPKGVKLGENEKPRAIQGDLKVQDLMDGKFHIAINGMIILITILFSLGIGVFIFMYKYDGEGSSATGGATDNGFDPSGSGMNTSRSSTGSTGGMLDGRIGGWFIEKLFGKDTIKKEGEEDNESFATKLFAILFIIFLFGGGTVLSASISSSIPIYFDQGFTGMFTLYGVGIVYLFSFLIFLTIITILVKFSLLSFIRMDMQKDENSSVPVQTFKLLGIGIILITVSSYLISSFGMQLISILIKS